MHARVCGLFKCRQTLPVLVITGPSPVTIPEAQPDPDPVPDPTPAQVEPTPVEEQPPVDPQPEPTEAPTSQPVEEELLFDINDGQTGSNQGDGDGVGG